MKLRVIIHAAEEGGYWAEVPALAGCFSQGETLDEALENIGEAAESWLEVAAETKESHTMSALQVTGIDHVTLVVADLERSRRFYCDVLGMRVVERPAFNFPGSWFQIGNQQIHLIQAHEGSAPAGFPAPAEYVRPGRTFHYAFEVADATIVPDVLKAHGIELKGEPRHRPDGCLQVFCMDPDGHVVEVFSRP